MDVTAKNLENSLNRIIDEELEKPYTEIDVKLIRECSEALLRMGPTDSYILPKARAEANIAEIIGSGRGKGRGRLTRTARTLLIAAAIIIFAAVTALSLNYAVRYDLIRLSDHSVITVNGTRRKSVGDFTVGYVPDGYVFDKEVSDKYTKSYIYKKDNRNLIITKESGFTEISVNTEFEEPSEFESEGVRYIVYGDKDCGYGVMCVRNGWRYDVEGMETPDILLSILKELE